MRIHYPGLVLLSLMAAASVRAGDMPGFVDIARADPTIALQIRYAGNDNFIGDPIDGYDAARCLLSAPAAQALLAAQRELRDFGLSLIVWDCFRPQRAVDHFMRWARDATDQRMKAAYYPHIDKSRLVGEGYIAERSGHSRGSTIDLGLADESGAPLDMGSAWDFFDPLAHTSARNIPEQARRNRLLLRALMEKHGFRNFPSEWWHYTLADEPYPDTFFDGTLATGVVVDPQPD